ncbi:hypothetical protein NIES2104_02290 [Leptolyngbya sp. NIES-2104]|nr:hypothetical protein NIES2104_02290 [Leptolyngbya sp. NIES-2104]
MPTRPGVEFGASRQRSKNHRIPVYLNFTAPCIFWDWNDRHFTSYDAGGSRCTPRR